MPKFRFNKLVRDKIVEQQLASGARPKFKRLTTKQHKFELVKKINEEAAEVLTAPIAQVASELADVQQALDDLIAKFGLTKAQVKREQGRKRLRSGAFKKGIYIEHLELDENDEWVTYYYKNLNRYPKIRT